MMKMLNRILLPALLALAILPAFGQGATLADLLAGIPTTLKLKELAGDWRRIVIDDQDSVAHWMSTFSGDIREQSAVIPVYYTKGQLLTCGGVTYLLAYRIAPNPSPSMLTPEGGTKPPPATAESLLSPALLDMRTAGSLRDIRPFNLEEEIAAQYSPDEINAMTVTYLRMLTVAALAWADNHGGKLPPLTDAAACRTLLAGSVSSQDIFIHPRTKEPFQPNPKLANQLVDGIADIKNAVIFFEASPAPDGTRAVAFVGGRVERIPEGKWQQMKQAAGIP